MHRLLFALLAFCGSVDHSVAQFNVETGKELLETCQSSPPFVCEVAIMNLTSPYTYSLGEHDERACLPALFDDDGFARTVVEFLQHDETLLDQSVDNTIVAILDHYGLAGAACSADRSESQYAIIDRCVWGRNPRCEELLREAISDLEMLGESVCLPTTVDVDELEDLVRDEVRGNLTERGRSASEIVLSVAAEHGWSGDACPVIAGDTRHADGPANEVAEDFGAVETFVERCHSIGLVECHDYLERVVVSLHSGEGTVCVPDRVSRDALYDYLALAVASNPPPLGSPAEDAVVDALVAIEWAGDACSGEQVGTGQTFLLRCGGPVDLACNTYMRQLYNALDDQGITTCVPGFVTAEQVELIFTEFLNENAEYLDAPATEGFAKSVQVFGPC